MSYDVDIGDDIGEVAATSHLLDELALYGYRPFDDEPDPRPLPEARIASGAVADMFDALVATLQDTRLEPDLEDLLWALSNIFHRAGERLERLLDDNRSEEHKSELQSLMRTSYAVFCL